MRCKRNVCFAVLLAKIRNALAVRVQGKVTAKEYVLAIIARSTADKAVRVGRQADTTCLNVQNVNTDAAKSSRDRCILGNGSIIGYDT